MAMWLKVATFPSKSSPGIEYTVSVHQQTGVLGCLCPAWRFKKRDKPRGCRHIDSISQDEIQRLMRLEPESHEWQLRAISMEEPDEGLVATVPIARRAFIMDDPLAAEGT